MVIIQKLWKLSDTLENITISPSFQENQHFINDIPIFKAKGPQSFGDWPEQIDKVALLTNKDPNKLALAKSKGSLIGQLVHFCPPWDGTKLKMVTPKFQFHSHQTACNIHVN